MRIAMIIQRYHPIIGGAENQLQKLIPHLRRYGHELIVITRKVEKLPSYSEVEGTPVYRVFGPGTNVISAFLFSIFTQNILRKFHPDVIHAHELLSPTTTAILAKRIFGTPVISKVLRGGKKGDINRIFEKPMGRLRWKNISRFTDKFIAISGEILEEVQNFGVDANRCVSIPNGVDIGKFLPVSLGKVIDLRKSLGINGDPILIYTGRLVPEKRIEDLLVSWGTIQNQYPDGKLLIIGAGPSERDLRNLQIDRTIFVGQTENVVEYLQASDIFILPSESEGLSNSMLEAMAVGLPCVVTNVGGALDIIDDQVSGCLFTPGDSAELTRQITDLLGNKEKANQIGIMARKKMVESFSLEHAAEQLHFLYSEIVKKD